MNKEKIKEQLKNAIERMKDSKEACTFYWDLDTVNNKRWAIVLGWSDGFEESSSDNYTDGTWRLCVKLAYQPKNSLMQCDYDIDWIMPYDEETGEVDDNEISIYPNYDTSEIIDCLLKCYETYLKCD